MSDFRGQFRFFVKMTIFFFFKTCKLNAKSDIRVNEPLDICGSSYVLFDPINEAILYNLNILQTDAKHAEKLTCF